MQGSKSFSSLLPICGARKKQGDLQNKNECHFDLYSPRNSNVRTHLQMFLSLYYLIVLTN